MVARTLLIACALVTAAPTLVSAQGPLGTELQVNTYTTDGQFDPTLCHDAAGNFVAVWTSEGQDGDGDGIFAQRHDSAGAPIGTELQVNSHTTDDQNGPAVCCADAGNFVVVWESDEQDGDDDGVFVRRFSSVGTPFGTELQVNTYTSNDQHEADVSCDPDGNFVVVWESETQDGDAEGVFGQRFDSAGMPAGTEFQVNTVVTGFEEDASVCCDDAGNFVVVWDTFPTAGGTVGVFGQRFASNGAPQGTEFKVNTYTTSDQDNPDVCCDAFGNFVVAWDSIDQDEPGHDREGYDIFGQRYARNGARAGTEFQVNTYTTDDQQAAEVCCNNVGNFVVVWQSEPQDGYGYGIFGQRFSGAGKRVDTEFQVNTYTTYGQYDPALSCADNGEFVVAWESVDGQDGDETGVFAQRFAAFAGALAPAPTMSWIGLGLTAVALLGGAVLRLRRRR